MTDEYEKYEEESHRIRAENEILLKDFDKWLSDKGLAKSTINRHRENMDFYLNHFLLYSDPEEAAGGVALVDGFLGWWFISKAAWATKASIKSNAASLKKFYTFMYERGEIEKEDLDLLKHDIREYMPEWLATLSRYDDPDVDFEDVWDM
jgi:site-specific recombinase XerD